MMVVPSQITAPSALASAALPQVTPDTRPETFMMSAEAQELLSPETITALKEVDKLKIFLASAPAQMAPKEMFNRFQLPTQEYVTCVLWNGVFYITGTDIVRCMTFRFQAFGRPVKNPKKFEEGIFSDLRNLKPGNDDALLEEPKSPFLEILYKNNCIRTQKKQKVFNWFSVPHDRLFLDALERDLKRESQDQETTTEAVSEPALSFQYDSGQTLFEQLMKALQQSASSAIVAERMLDSYNAGPAAVAWDMPPPPLPVLSSASSSLLEVPKLEPIDSIDDYSVPPLGPNPVLLNRSYITDEVSPAPSFESSVLDDTFDPRLAMPFEPMTPDTLHSVSVKDLHYYDDGRQEQQYIDYDSSTSVDSYRQHRHMEHPAFSGGRNVPNPTYQVNLLGGTPVYKQRRRRSSGNSSLQSYRRPIPSSMPAQVETDLQPRHFYRPNAQFVQPSQQAHHHRRRHQIKEEEEYENEDFLDYSQYLDDQFVSNTGSQYLEQLPSQHSYHGAFSPMPLASVGGGPMKNKKSRAELHEPYVTANPLSGRDASGRKTHTCPESTCGRVFTRQEHLKRHVRTHTKERPYSCHICGKEFSRSDNLAQHRRTHDKMTVISDNHVAAATAAVARHPRHQHLIHPGEVYYHRHESAEFSEPDDGVYSEHLHHEDEDEDDNERFVDQYEDIDHVRGQSHRWLHPQPRSESPGVLYVPQQNRQIYYEAGASSQSPLVVEDEDEDGDIESYQAQRRQSSLYDRSAHYRPLEAGIDY